MATVLIVLMALMALAFTALGMRQVLRNVDKTLASVYQDRLQPAVELVYLNENLYAKRLLLESHVSNHSALSITALRAQLRQPTENSYRRIDTLEKTELTGQEAQQLHLFKMNVATYADLESSILHLTETGQHQRAVELFKKPGHQLFQPGIQQLHGLTTIQHETGQRAVDDAHRQAGGGAINATLLVGLAIIPGLMIQQLLVPPPPKSS